MFKSVFVYTLLTNNLLEVMEMLTPINKGGTSDNVKALRNLLRCVQTKCEMSDDMCV